MYPRLSWSSLNAYEECAMRHKLQRARKRKPIPEHVILVGNVLHYASEQLILGSCSADEIVEQSVRDFDRRVDEATMLGWDAQEIDEHRGRVFQGASRLVELYAEEFKDWIGVWGGLVAELHILKFYRSWALEGYMDVAMMTHENVPKAIYDVKTGSSHKRGQLEFYSVLCEAYFGAKPDHLYWIEPLGRGIVEVVVTDEEHNEMQQRIAQAAEKIMKGEFPVSGFPSKCGWCSSRDFCSATEASRTGKFTTSGLV
jgi:CRISPR/Cas system-associated exonuclease Cas4 (RecB family)